MSKGIQNHGLKKPVLWAVAGFHADYPVLRSQSLLYPSKKGPDIASGPWSYHLRRFLVLELRREELAVQTGQSPPFEKGGREGLSI